MEKTYAKTKQHPEAELKPLENYSLSLSMSPFKVNMTYSKKYCKNKCACVNGIVWLIIMKMRLKIKNRSHSYDTIPRHGSEYTKYKIISMGYISVW